MIATRLLLPALLPALRVCPRAPAPLQCETSSAKAHLLAAVEEYNAATAADGMPSVDFGVQGGELDGESRAPRDLAKAGAFYAVSDRVGAAADAVLAAVEDAAAVNPTAEPTAAFGSPEGATACPLHGRWYNAFSTAADAVFSRDSKRGGAVVSNLVDATSGRTTNIIEFTGSDHPAFRATRTPPRPSPIESLKVILSATAISPSRIELVFRRVRARLRVRLFGLTFGLTLILPVPGPFLTRLLFLFRPKKAPPPAYFDVLFLDDDLRVHKTAQGNLFVQRRLPAAA